MTVQRGLWPIRRAVSKNEAVGFKGVYGLLVRLTDFKSDGGP